MDAGEDALAEGPHEVDRRIISALVRARAELGLQHRVQMAELMGVDPSTYNRWEEGTRRIPAWALLKAAEVSGKTTAFLLEEIETGEKPRPEHVARISRNEREIAELRANLAAADEREQRQAQKYDEMADKMDGLTEALNQFMERRRRQSNGGEQAAGS